MTDHSAAPRDQSSDPQACVAACAGKYLACMLGGVEYGIDILNVKQVRVFEMPTRIADTPAQVLGVQRHRSDHRPAAALGHGHGAACLNGRSAIVVRTVGGQVIGAVVDGANDVLRLDARNLRPLPGYDSSSVKGHLQAIGLMGERLLS